MFNHKEYYQENKDKFKEYNRKSRLKNRKRVNLERRNEKPINCPCGGSYKKQHKSDHYKTKKHQSYMQRKHVMITLDDLTITWY